MIIDILIAVASVVLVVGAVSFYIFKRRPRTIKHHYFQDKWSDMQKLLASKDTWREAVINADKLLDEALKKKRFPGKTMGERLTKAQRILSNNENVWFGHKLRNKLDDDPGTKLKEKDVKQALIGIRQALKDLGALPERKLAPSTATEAEPASVTPIPTPKPTPKAKPKAKMPAGTAKRPKAKGTKK